MSEKIECDKTYAVTNDPSQRDYEVTAENRTLMAKTIKTVETNTTAKTTPVAETQSCACMSSTEIRNA